MAERLFDAERRFMDIIWDAEPVNSTELTKLTLQALGWKKSTTYNMLRRLVERGFAKNEDATVSSLVSREEYLCRESSDLIDKSFSGSMPAFVAAYLRDRRLSQNEIEDLHRMIEEARD